MTTEEITTGNRLIAEFMGFENCIVRNSKGRKYDYNLPNGFELIKEVETTIESNWCEILDYQDYCMAEDLKFYSSWDWLMPVVEKIEELRFNNRGAWVKIESFIAFGKRYYQCNIKIKDTNGGDYLFELESDWNEIKIEATYKAVIEFIK